MPKMLCQTKGPESPKGKPRVYFTCHPEDFEKYYPKVVKDIFKTHDCVIYYTEDMGELFDEENLETDLGQMNLVVVPVTWKLLSQPNRAMDKDIPYAKRAGIPILPFMMEPGIDVYYNSSDKFGPMQYLCPVSSDLTELRYEDKLKKHLDSVLINDEMAARIRAAFDAYVFLSYRKKDRRLANQLIKLMHKNPQYWDIAVWYDEYLTPGDSFVDGIKKALNECNLFTLLVTPNLLEEPDGKPNYVMAVEYPTAKKENKKILPVEMEPTDHIALAEKFPDIPDCIDPNIGDGSIEQMLQAVERIAHTVSDDELEHNFLIGLAYFEGIDVEVDRTRGIEMIAQAAEKGLLEAMEKLYSIYTNEASNECSDKMALYWIEKIADYHVKHYGEEHVDTLEALNNLADTYERLNNPIMAKEVYERVYVARCSILGEMHPDTLLTLNGIAKTLQGLAEYEDALALHKTVYRYLCESVGPNSEEAMIAYISIATACGNLCMDDLASGMLQTAYDYYSNLYGECHIKTLAVLYMLGQQYHYSGERRKAKEVFKKAYHQYGEQFGKEHPMALDCKAKMESIELEMHALNWFARKVKNFCIGSIYLIVVIAVAVACFTKKHLYKIIAVLVVMSFILCIAYCLFNGFS